MQIAGLLQSVVVAEPGQGLSSVRISLDPKNAAAIAIFNGDAQTIAPLAVFVNGYVILTISPSDVVPDAFLPAAPAGQPA